MSFWNGLGIFGILLAIVLIIFAALGGSGGSLIKISRD